MVAGAVLKNSRSSPRIGVRISRPPHSLFSPKGSANYPQGLSQGRSQRTGLFRSTAIFAQTATKGKSENDLSFLFHRLGEGRGVLVLAVVLDYMGCNPGAPPGSDSWRDGEPSPR